MGSLNWPEFKAEALRLGVTPQLPGALAAVEAGTYAEELGATLAQAREVASVVLEGCADSPVQAAYEAWEVSRVA